MSTTNTKVRRNSINSQGASPSQKAATLLKYLQTGDNEKFEILIDSVASSSAADLDFILNTWQDSETKHFLLTYAADNNNLGIMSKILSFKCCNPNVAMPQDLHSWKFRGSTSIHIACHNKNYQVCKLLLDHNADVNLKDGDERTAMSIISSKDEVEIARLLIEKGFDFKRLINATKKSGLSAFTNCVMNNATDTMDYFFDELEPKFKHKIDLYNLIKPKKKQMNALQLACDKTKDAKLVKYLLEKLKFCNPDLTGVAANKAKRIRKIANINYLTLNGRTAAWYAAKRGSLPILKVLHQYKCDLDILDKDGKSPLHAACEEGWNRTVMWLLSSGGCDVNKCDKSQEKCNYPAIITAIRNDNYACVEAICLICTDTVQILECDALLEAAACGNTRIFQMLLSTLIERMDVNDYASLIKSDIFNRRRIDQLFEEAKKHESLAIMRLLRDIETKCLNTGKMGAKGDEKGNFGLLMALLDYDGGDVAKQNIDRRHVAMRRDFKIASKLMEYIQKCDENSQVKGLKGTKLSELIAEKLNDAINGMIENKEILNDSLLFFAKLVDERRLITNLNDSLANLFDNKDSNLLDQSWYTSTLLASNVWSLQRQENENVRSELLQKTATNTKQEDQKTNETSVTSPNSRHRDSSIFKRWKEMGMLSDGTNESQAAMYKSFFYEARQGVLRRELNKLETFMKKQIKMEEERDLKSWKKMLKYPDFNAIDSDIIRQDGALSRFNDKWGNQRDFMKEFGGTLPKYKQKVLFTDLNTGFNGPDAYDHDAYLSNLLINAHRLNIPFQAQCREIFSEKKLFVKCHFHEAPVKMKSRCTIKSVTEYKDRKWPLSANLLDLIRCTAIFDTPKDLIAGLDRCEQLISSEQCGDVKEVIRIKNGFQRIYDSLKYADVKMNVLITVTSPYDKTQLAMIGEIQFVLNWVQLYKNMAHVSYRFVRNGKLFGQLSHLFYDDNSSSTDSQSDSQDRAHDKKVNKLTNIIATRNTQKLETLLLYYDLISLERTHGSRKVFLKSDSFRGARGAKVWSGMDLLYKLLVEYGWKSGCWLYWQAVLKTSDAAFVEHVVNSDTLWQGLLEMKAAQNWQKVFVTNELLPCTLLKAPNKQNAKDLKKKMKFWKELDDKDGDEDVDN